MPDRERSVTPKNRNADAVRRPGTKPREKPQQIADELRRLIILGELDEGDSLGHEPDLIERFGASVREVTHRQENVHFPLPRELRALKAHA